MDTDPKNYSDEHIVARIQAGDDAVFSWLFRKYYADLVGFAASQIGRVDIAEELVCEVFTSLLARRTHWKPSGRVDAYLFRAVRNLTYNYLRSKARESANLQKLQSETVGSSIDTGDMEAAVELAARELPDRAREIVSLRWRHGMSFEAIAEIMETTPGAVRTQLSRSMAMLRELAKKYLDEM